MALDYAEKPVKFFYIYKNLAHPGWNNYTAPFTIDERRLHLAEAERVLGTQIPWLCDNHENAFSKAMGGAPNSEFIIDPDGKIVVRHGWNDPKRLHAELAKLVGAIANPIDPKSLDLPSPMPVAVSETGVVPTLVRPQSMRPISMEPGTSDNQEPFYAKLRVEGTPDVFKDGNGQLYLGFLLDPLYQVHWNNLVTPIHVELKGPESIVFEPESLDGPKIEQAADSDPREFLCQVDHWQADAIVTVKVAYYACNDAAGWCKRIEQSYELQRKPDRSAGFSFRPEQIERLDLALDRKEREPPPQHISASTQEIAHLVGVWEMQTFEPGSPKPWELHIEESAGMLSGWSTFDRAKPTIDILSFDGRELRFLQLDSGLAPDEVRLELKDGKLSGTHLSAFGDFEVSGKPQTVKANEAGTPQPGEVRPLPQAHAHNDYHHVRPLHDALEHGFCSLEADIFLVDGQLLVGHDRSELGNERTLQTLYLDPLRQLAQQNQQRVFPGGPTITLLIDIKENGREAYAVLRDVLATYKDILSSIEHGVEHVRAVQVVISGDRPKAEIAADEIRYAAIDGRLADLDSQLPANLMPLISDRWTLHFKWQGKGEFPGEERERLHAIVNQAHASGRRVRFWATPETGAVWNELLTAGVDHINTDQLDELRDFLLRKSPNQN